MPGAEWRAGLQVGGRLGRDRLPAARTIAVTSSLWELRPFRYYAARDTDKLGGM